MENFSNDQILKKIYSDKRIRVHFEAHKWNEEVIIQFSGGQKHIGALYLNDGLQNEIIRYAPKHHRETDLIDWMMETLHHLQVQKLLIYGGIHYDNITSDELAFIRDCSRRFCEECIKNFNHRQK